MSGLEQWRAFLRRADKRMVDSMTHSSDLDLGGGNMCAWCKQPARGVGRIDDEYFCHPSCECHPDCYTRATLTEW